MAALFEARSEAWQYVEPGAFALSIGDRLQFERGRSQLSGQPWASLSR
jgi:hypothetical protein